MLCKTGQVKKVSVETIGATESADVHYDSQYPGKNQFSESLNVDSKMFSPETANTTLVKRKRKLSQVTCFKCKSLVIFKDFFADGSCLPLSLRFCFFVF